MTVCGQYVSRFSEASHVLFDGHLDNPSFRSIAIQKIECLSGDCVTLSKSGSLKIRDGREQTVSLPYKGIFGGVVRTTGHPFKDSQTAAIGRTEVEGTGK